MQFDSDVYGYKNSATRQFITYFVDKYAKGTGTPSRFKKLFNEMESGSDKGTQDPEDAKDLAEAKANAKSKPGKAPAIKGKKAV